MAGRKLIDAQRSETSRRRREVRDYQEPAPGPTEQDDDTLLLLSRCCHPLLSPASAIALALRAVGGLTTAQIAQAILVPEPTMAQRISRAKRTVSGERFEAPGDIRAVLRVLYLIFNEGFTGEVDLAVEAIRLTRQLAGSVEDPEVAGLLALMLLHHARRPARRAADGSLVPLPDQDRGLWDTSLIREGIDILQAALAADRLGEYQAQAAIAALHDDAATAEVGAAALQRQARRLTQSSGRGRRGRRPARRASRTRRAGRRPTAARRRRSVSARTGGQSHRRRPAVCVRSSPRRHHR